MAVKVSEAKALSSLDTALPQGQSLDGGKDKTRIKCFYKPLTKLTASDGRSRASTHLHGQRRNKHGDRHEVVVFADQNVGYVPLHRHSPQPF